MKTTLKSMFSNGTEFTSWQFRNCDKCVKASVYKEKKDVYTNYKCTIQRDIDGQVIGLQEVPLRSYNATQLADCPYRQTERKARKKRVIKNQLNLEL